MCSAQMAIDKNKLSSEQKEKCKENTSLDQNKRKKTKPSSVGKCAKRKDKAKQQVTKISCRRAQSSTCISANITNS